MEYSGGEQRFSSCFPSLCPRESHQSGARDRGRGSREGAFTFHRGKS